jgi:hypothetical protein
MEHIEFQEEDKFKGKPSFHKNKSSLVNTLMSLGVGEKLAAQSLIIVAVISILVSFVFMYNLVTNTFSPVTVPVIEQQIEDL